MKLRFEWDTVKAAAIGVATASHSNSRVQYLKTLFVAYTEREDRIRIISARRATEHEEEDYFQQNS